MHIGYVPRERPPFSALNFRSGAYHFHKLPKKIRSGASPVTFFGGFCRSRHHHVKHFFNFNPFISSYGTQSVRQRRGLAAVLEIRIFTLKTAQACSGAPRFHARPGARSGALAHFSLCRGTYLPKLGGEYPPPPGGGGNAIILALSIMHGDTFVYLCMTRFSSSLQ